MNFFQRLLNIAFSVAEFLLIYLLGMLLGIEHVIKYLRNPNPKISKFLLVAFGAKIGKNTTLKRSLFFDNVYEDQNSKKNFKNLKIGNNCYVGDSVYFDLSDEIKLEDNVVISAYVKFITHRDCNRSSELEKIYPRKTAPILVKGGSWVSIDASILLGVQINQNSVIGAQSLVTSDIDEASLYAGTPAKKIKSLM